MAELRLPRWVAYGLLLSACFGCSAGGDKGSTTSPGNGGSLSLGGNSSAGTPNLGGDGPGLGGLSMGGDAPQGEDDVPTDCTQAMTKKTYIGCDFWPTVTYNPVFSEFDFAVVIANPNTAVATITVTGPAAFTTTEMINGGELKAIKLPWVKSLKGMDFDKANTQNGRAKESIRVDAGAYHVVSSLPVTAWQFSPLQYKKPEAEVPMCGTRFGQPDCFSASNDASLLVPSTAMTGNYRVFGRSAIFGGAAGMAYTSASSGFAITATAAGTHVKMQFPAGCGADTFNPPMLAGCVAPGTGVMAANGGMTAEYDLNAGDVLELVGMFATGDGLKHADLSGTVINATKPIQVIAFNPISNIPDTATNADHVEETVLPGEVISNKYVVAPPTSPGGTVKGGHIVRIYGNVDGTTLTYAPSAPAGAPTTIAAGAVVEFGPVMDAFTVEGNEPFVVGSFMVGGQLQAPPGDACPNFPCRGDPSMSMMVTPAQFRKEYTFLAPADYEANFADIVVPTGANVTIDEAPLKSTPTAITADWSIVREPLSATGGGVHKLKSDKNVGLQVMGFGHATSYYYPGGLNLRIISKPPVVK